MLSRGRIPVLRFCSSRRRRLLSAGALSAYPNSLSESVEGGGPGLEKPEKKFIIDKAVQCSSDRVREHIMQIRSDQSIIWRIPFLLLRVFLLFVLQNSIGWQRTQYVIDVSKKLFIIRVSIVLVCSSLWWMMTCNSSCSPDACRSQLTIRLKILTMMIRSLQETRRLGYTLKLCVHYPQCSRR